MRDNKILILIFIPILISIIVANSEIHPVGKSILFGASALCLLFAGCVSYRQSKASKKE